MYKGFGWSLVFLPTDMIQHADSHQFQSDDKSTLTHISAEKYNKSEKVFAPKF